MPETRTLAADDLHAQHTVRFSKGDPVPTWVMHAPTPEQQARTTFGTNVIVSHAGEQGFPYGSVTVRPVALLDDDDYLIVVTGDVGGKWSDADTLLDTTPAAESD